MKDVADMRIFFSCVKDEKEERIITDILLNPSNVVNRNLQACFMGLPCSLRYRQSHERLNYHKECPSNLL